MGAAPSGGCTEDCDGGAPIGCGGAYVIGRCAQISYHTHTHTYTRTHNEMSDVSCYTRSLELSVPEADTQNRCIRLQNPTQTASNQQNRTSQQQTGPQQTHTLDTGWRWRTQRLRRGIPSTRRGSITLARGQGLWRRQRSGCVGPCAVGLRHRQRRQRRRRATARPGLRRRVHRQRLRRRQRRTGAGYQHHVLWRLRRVRRHVTACTAVVLQKVQSRPGPHHHALRRLIPVV